MKTFLTAATANRDAKSNSKQWLNTGEQQVIGLQRGMHRKNLNTKEKEKEQ